MPLVHIHVFRSANRSPERLRLLAETIQEVMMSHFHAPPRDRYQIITQHDEGELICEDSNLPGLPRSNELVFLQIFQQGRNREIKEATYNELMKQLGMKCGLGKPTGAIGGKTTDRGGKVDISLLAGPGNLIISVAENGKEDWSFGAGRAQFLTGEL
jgi:phenylpyruvate tautomerase PptA (4-oxalocrotonate tautomerase family)